MLQQSQLGPKFQVEEVAPTNHSSCHKTMMNDLSCGVRIRVQVYFIRRLTRLADGRTVRQLSHGYIRCCNKNVTEEIELITTKGVIVSRVPRYVFVNINMFCSRRCFLLLFCVIVDVIVDVSRLQRVFAKMSAPIHLITGTSSVPVFYSGGAMPNDWLEDPPPWLPLWLRPAYCFALLR